MNIFTSFLFTLTKADWWWDGAKTERLTVLCVKHASKSFPDFCRIIQHRSDLEEVVQVSRYPTVQKSLAAPGSDSHSCSPPLLLPSSRAAQALRPSVTCDTPHPLTHPPHRHTALIQRPLLLSNKKQRLKTGCSSPPASPAVQLSFYSRRSASINSSAFLTTVA